MKVRKEYRRFKGKNQKMERYYADCGGVKAWSKSVVAKHELACYDCQCIKVAFKLMEPNSDGSIPCLELLRTQVGDVGKVGTRRYKSWKVEYNSKDQVLSISSKSYSEWFYTIFLENGDINVYRDYDDGGWANLEPVENLVQIANWYYKNGFYPLFRLLQK